jgi:cytochrome o ubiquinol oxidase operon protein cyoD
MAADNHSHDAAGASHGSMKSYVLGFVYAVILTVVPFAMVMSGAFPRGFTIITMFVLAAVQVLVHLVYFLHMDRSSAQRWNVMVFAFSVLIIAIVVVGSLWVLHNMNANMMH